MLCSYSDAEIEMLLDGNFHPELMDNFYIDAYLYNPIPTVEYTILDTYMKAKDEGFTVTFEDDGIFEEWVKTYRPKVYAKWKNG